MIYIFTLYNRLFMSIFSKKSLSSIKTTFDLGSEISNLENVLRNETSLGRFSSLNYKNVFESCVSKSNQLGFKFDYVPVAVLRQYIEEKTITEKDPQKLAKSDACNFLSEYYTKKFTLLLMIDAIRTKLYKVSANEKKDQLLQELKFILNDAKTTTLKELDPLITKVQNIVDNFKDFCGISYDCDEKQSDLKRSVQQIKQNVSKRS